MQNTGATTVDTRRHKALGSLQCARGLAALLVVYYHASAVADPTLSASWIGEDLHQKLGLLATHLPVLGKCGVDLFFLISGYIIWTSTLSKMNTITFYKRRIARIVPLYWVNTLLVAFVLIFLPGIFKTLRLDASHLLASLLFVPWSNPAFAPGSQGEYTPLIVAGWTLNFEMMFYFLFGLVVGRKRARLRAVLLTFVAFTTVTIFAERWVDNLRFYDPFLIAEFMLGCALTALGDRLVCTRAMAIASLVIALVGLLVLDMLEPPVSRFFSMGIPAFVVLFALIQLERGGWWPRLRPLAVVGDASYSIYLTHIIALAIVRYAWQPFASSLVFKPAQEAFCVSIMVVAIAIGLFCFKFVEQPLVSLAEGALGIKRRGGLYKLPDNLTPSPLALKVP